MNLSDCTPDRGVVYRPHPNAPSEDGTVVRCSESFVFVLFVGDRHPKACRPEDLTPLTTASTKENP